VTSMNDCSNTLGLVSVNGEALHTLNAVYVTSFELHQDSIVENTNIARCKYLQSWAICAGKTCSVVKGTGWSGPLRFVQQRTRSLLQQPLTQPF
jgi:hypothetical protein